MGDGDADGPLLASFPPELLGALARVEDLVDAVLAGRGADAVDERVDRAGTSFGLSAPASMAMSTLPVVPRSANSLVSSHGALVSLSRLDSRPSATSIA